MPAITISPMKIRLFARMIGVCLLSLSALFPAIAEERTEHFDRDPGWEGHNNRLAVSPRTIRQDFGYGKSSHASGPAGEIGGFITAAAEPAYYAKKLPVKTFHDGMSASGTLVCHGRPWHA